MRTAPVVMARGALEDVSSSQATKPKVVAETLRRTSWRDVPGDQWRFGAWRTPYERQLEDVAGRDDHEAVGELVELAKEGLSRPLRRNDDRATMRLLAKLLRDLHEEIHWRLSQKLFVSPVLSQGIASFGGWILDLYVRPVAMKVRLRSVSDTFHRAIPKSFFAKSL